MDRAGAAPDLMRAAVDSRAALLAVAIALVGCEKSGASQGTTSASSGASSPTVASTTQPTAAATTAAPSATAPAPPKADGVRFVDAPEDADTLSTIRSERLKAKADGRVLVVYVGATWCPPCKEFHHKSHAGFFDARAGKITLLVFDADRDTERLGAAGYKFRYVPYFALPRADGHPAEEHEMKGKAGAQTTEEIAQQLEAWQRKGG